MTYSSIGTIEDRNKFDGSLIYRGDEFVQKTGRDKFESSRRKDKEKWFIDQNTGLIKGEYQLQRDCPLCHSQDSTRIFNKDGFEHVECCACQFVYVSPTLNDLAQSRHYKEECDWTQVMISEEERRVNRIMYNYAFKYFESALPGSQRKLLDIGSGSGLFLEVAKDRHWTPVGIEHNQAMLDRCQNLQLKVYPKTINDVVAKEGKFDLISMWYVLEHIEDVHSLMEEITGAIADNGLFYVSIPHIDCLASRLLGKDATVFSGYSHLNFFNLQTLEKLMAQYSFDIVAAETQVTQLRTIRNYFSHGLTAQSHLKQLIDNLTPEFIHDNFLGTYLAVVCKRKS